MGRKQKTTWITLGQNLFVWICTAGFMYPIVWLISTAFKNRVDAFAIPPKHIFVPIFDNFQSVLSSGNFMSAYKNSLIISVGTCALALLLGTPMAYALARFNVPNKNGLLMWLLSTRMAPVVLIAIPYYVIYQKIGLRGTYLGMILVYLIFNLAFTVWMLKGFIEGVPVELSEASRVDGCSRLKAFLTIEIPLMKGGIAATAIISFITVWNEFLLALVLTSFRTQTTPVAIQNFISFEGIRWGEIAAAGVLVAAPAVILGIAVRKYLISGMTMGAVKS
jgi:multiple sugar transport system permease protein